LRFFPSQSLFAALQAALFLLHSLSEPLDRSNKDRIDINRLVDGGSALPQLSDYALKNDVGFSIRPPGAGYKPKATASNERSRSVLLLIARDLFVVPFSPSAASFILNDYPCSQR
jgi:hypothetical protein